MPFTKYPLSEIPDLTGKVAIVTGPKTGIGLETVALLASKGCTVYLAGRGDLTPAITTLKSRPGLTNATLLPLPLDLSTSATSLAGAGAFPKDSRLDILIANAGISLDMRTEPSAEGWEHHFQTNQIGHFAFITALLPVVERSANEHGEARIVLLGSEAWKFATRPIDYDALRKELPKSALGLVGGMKRYGTSKFAEMIFAHELARRLAARGVENVYVNSVHPGAVANTNLGGTGEQLGIPKFIGSTIKFMVGLLSFSNKDGAGASVFSATAKEVVENGIRGEYIKPIVGWNLGFGGVRIGKVDEMKDPEAGAKLWEACEKTVYGNDSTA